MRNTESNPKPITFSYINPKLITTIFKTHSFLLHLLRHPLLSIFSKTLQDLDTLAESDTKNLDVVLSLYEALRSRDVKSVHQILNPDLEWWFHGPPPHQFLMRVLTGGISPPPFEFVPLSVVSFGSTVIAEGCDSASSISWIHAWTVSHGIITQVREYSNTSLTVTRIATSHCNSVWESRFSGRAGKSVPGLVLAI